MAKPLKTELRNFGWEGGRAILIRQKVVEGPDAMLDRYVHLKLSFEQINDLVEHMREAVKRLLEQDVKLAAINTKNAE